MVERPDKGLSLFMETLFCAHDPDPVAVTVGLHVADTGPAVLAYAPAICAMPLNLCALDTHRLRSTFWTMEHPGSSCHRESSGNQSTTVAIVVILRLGGACV